MKLFNLTGGRNEADSQAPAKSDARIAGALGRSIVDHAVVGWAYDEADPSRSLTIEILIDDKPVGTVTTDLARPDLQSLLGFVPDAGFRVQVPIWAADGGAHSVVAIEAGSGVRLKHSGIVLPMPEYPPEMIGTDTEGRQMLVATGEEAEPLYDGSVNRATAEQIEGWAWSRLKPDDPVTLRLGTNTGFKATFAAGLFREDLLKADKGNGFHAFLFDVPAELRDGRVHTAEIEIAGAGHVLRRGRFTIGPVLDASHSVFTRDAEEVARSKAALSLPADLVFSAARLHTGEAVRCLVRLGELADVSEVTLNFTALRQPVDVGNKFLIHTAEQGLQSGAEVKLKRVVAPGPGSLWEGVFRPVARRPGRDLRGQELLGLPVDASFTLDVSLGEGAKAATLPIFLPIGVTPVAPLTVSALDLEPGSRDNANDGIKASRAAAEGPALPVSRIDTAFPGYVLPRILGHVMADVAADLGTLADFTALDLERAEEQVLQQRPDLVVLQADRVLRERNFADRRGPKLLRAAEAAQLFGGKLVVLFDADGPHEKQQLKWLLKRADIVVDVVGAGADALAEDSGPSTVVLARGPFVAAGRANPFRPAPATAKGEAVTEGAAATVLLDGFWDLLEQRDEAVLATLAQARGRLHVVDSNFEFPRDRAREAGDFYWNLLGSVEAAERQRLFGAYEELLLLPSTNLRRFQRFRTVFEALTAGALPSLIGAAEGHAYAPAAAALWAAPMPSPALRGRPVVLRDAYVHQGLRRVLAAHGAVPLVNDLVESARPALAANNRKAVAPKIAVVVVSADADRIDAAIARFEAQTHGEKELVLVVQGNAATPRDQERWRSHPAVAHLEFVSLDKTIGYCLNLAVDVTSAAYVAVWADTDLYGANYLADFALYLQGRPIDLFVRPVGFTWDPGARALRRRGEAGGEAFLVHGGKAPAEAVGSLGTLIVARDLARRLGFSETRRGGVDGDFVRRALAQKVELVTGDVFGYAEARPGDTSGEQVVKNVELSTALYFIDADAAAMTTKLASR